MFVWGEKREQTNTFLTSSEELMSLKAGESLEWAALERRRRPIQNCALTRAELRC